MSSAINFSSLGIGGGGGGGTGDNTAGSGGSGFIQLFWDAL